MATNIRSHLTNANLFANLVHDVEQSADEMNWYPILWRKTCSAKSRVTIVWWSLWNRAFLSLHPSVTFAAGLQVTGPVVWRIHPVGSLVLGREVRINSGPACNALGGHRRSIIAVLPDGKLTIGDNSGLSSSTVICQRRIEIGRQVRIGGGCTIVDTDFHSLRLAERIARGNPGVNSRPVRIADGAFVGAGSWVLKGVSIGAEAVVGAGSLVSRNVPDGEIWAGNPARFIRRIGDTANAESAGV